MLAMVQGPAAIAAVGAGLAAQPGSSINNAILDGIEAIEGNLTLFDTLG